MIDELRSIKANLEETLEEFRRQIFGVRSEKTSASKSTEEPKKEEAKKIHVKAHTKERKPKATRDDLYKDLPIREILCKVPDDERFCEWCNSEMVTMASTFIREEIRITPAKVERIHYMQEVLICPECKKDHDGSFKKGVAPVALIPNSLASASAVAYIMFQKCFMGLPYYRLEAAMKQLGVKIPRETMANWCILSTDKYLKAIYEYLHEVPLSRKVIHADETTCQVLREDGKTPQSTSYMWIYTSGSDGLPKIVLYEYQPGRGGVYSQQFLKGFQGMIQCDGYQGYNKVEDVLLACCMAHCRRKFFEALPAERKKKRLEQEVHIWENFFAWIDSLVPTKGSKFEKAVKYAQNHRESLRTYLQDGRCELSNNAAERCAKSYAIGRKNSLFHTSVDGAVASSIIYSLVETAKANDLNVYQYLYILLLYMPGCLKDGSEGIEQLMPWSTFIKERCTGLIDVENISADKLEGLPHK